MSITRKIVDGVKGKFKSTRSISWQRGEGESQGVIWRLPNEVYPNVKSMAEIVANEYERAALYISGTYSSVLSQGRHDIPKGVDEVIFVDTAPRDMPFGIPRSKGPLTKDGARFGFSGKITCRVGDSSLDIGKFLTKIVASRKTISYEELVAWLRDGPLNSVFQDIAKNYDYPEFITIDRDELLMELEAKLGPELYDNGIELVSLEITNFTEPLN
ncbi:SPFH domain-containing protein [Candidatus Bathyarchaeota archaeon]|nr:SPFH domain-containing protein [Candidatus Bathyarchaeota archaeon]